MPYEPTFWAKGFGMLIDRYEIPWMVNAQRLGLTACPGIAHRRPGGLKQGVPRQRRSDPCPCPTPK